MHDIEPIDPSWREPRRLGSSTVSVGRLGLGLREIGRDPENTRVLLDTARGFGISYVDTAATYGHGIAEYRLGQYLRSIDRDQMVVSTKVGQLLRPPSTRRHLADVVAETVAGGEPGLDATARRARHAASRVRGQITTRLGSVTTRLGARAAAPAPELAPAPDATSLVEACDYSYDGVLRSLDESLERMGTDRVDLLYLHDPEVHRRQALKGACRALERLRAEGTIGAIGVGMNHARRLAWFIERTRLDVVMIAGRYSLLDQTAERDLFPVARDHGVSVVVAGALNGGLLADPRRGSYYNYAPAPRAMVTRAQRLRSICERHGVRLMAVALQFCFAHPDATALLLGAATPLELVQNVQDLQTTIPAGLWAELDAAGVTFRGDRNA